MVYRRAEEAEKLRAGIMNDLAARCEVLEQELGDARERIRQLEAELGSETPFPLSFGLSSSEAKILGLLLNRPLMTKEQAMSVLYCARSRAEEVAEPKIVDVFVCKLRAKMKPFGISVETVWGQGFRMTAEQKAAVGALLEAESAC